MDGVMVMAGEMLIQIHRSVRGQRGAVTVVAALPHQTTHTKQHR